VKLNLSVRNIALESLEEGKEIGSSGQDQMFEPNNTM
jgi:hypothetical protein